MGYTADTPMCATPQASLDQMTRYINKFQPQHDAADIAGAYKTLCALHGIDYVLALAQAVVETGNFSSWWWAFHLNPAGIMVNGDTRTAAQGRPGVLNWQWNPQRQLWVQGRHFNSITEAVANHVGLLAVYCRDAQKGTAPTSLAFWSRGNKLPSTHVCFNTVVSPLHLGAQDNPKKIGWAYPGVDKNGMKYGTKIANVANAIALA